MHFEIVPISDGQGIRKYTFEKGITRLPDNLFLGSNQIEQMTIPETVTEIGGSVFGYNRNLKSIVLPKNLTYIGDKAFIQCPKLTQINLADTVITEVPARLFEGCSGLESVVLPNSVVAINDGAFRNCTSLTSLKLSNNVTSLGEYCFSKSGISSVNIPDGVKVIPTGAFAECNALTGIEVGAGVTEIGNLAFANSQSLASVKLPYGLEKIGSQAFANDPQLKEIVIPKTVTSIGEGAFTYPQNLTIYGAPGSYAQTCAKTIGANFVVREVPIEKLDFSERELTLDIGEECDLIVNVTPIDYTEKLSWKSANSTVVTVGENGHIVAKSVGSATVKVLGENDAEAFIKINVVQPILLNLNKTLICLDGGDSFQLVATPYPEGSPAQDVIWTSENSEIASVDENGRVTGHIKGETKIIARIRGSKYSTECSVIVNSTMHIVEALEDFASPHKYETSNSDRWGLNLPGATKLAITFDSQTDVEEGFDYIKLFDGNKQLLGVYTGTELAGKRIEVDGDSVIVQLIADESGTRWGFAVTKIEQISPAVNTVEITKQPINAQVLEGEKAFYQVEASGTKLCCRWQTSVDGTNWADVNAEQKNARESLQLVADMSKDGLYIRCIVTDIFGNTVNSNAVRLIVKVPIVITTQPQSVIATENEVARYTIAATGKNITYTWKYSTTNGTSWRNIAGSAGSKTYLNIVAEEKWNGALLKCIVTDSDGESIESSVAKLSIKKKLAITSQPQNTNVELGKKASFQVSVSRDDVTYQWYYSTDQGKNYVKSTATNATKETFRFTANNKWNGVMVKCVITDSDGVQLTSLEAQLTLKNEE